MPTRFECILTIALGFGVCIPSPCIAADSPGKPQRDMNKDVNINIVSSEAVPRLFDGSEFWSLMLRHTPSAVAAFDTEMRYIAATQRWIDDYQLNDQQILGRSHYECISGHPAALEGHPPALPGRRRGTLRRRSFSSRGRANGVDTLGNTSLASGERRNRWDYYVHRGHHRAKRTAISRQ